MTSALLLLLMLIKAQSVSCFPSCPASCVVCSKEAVICQRLAYIIAAPQTTQALFLTEGSISTVQPGTLSDLSNVTVISLSHNRISALDGQSFRNMPFLQTLLLDHNLLTSQALQGGALNNLTHLEVLALGNNCINMINSDLFKGTKSLRILKLDGNQITRLESGSFSLNSLQALESLDISDNFINFLDKNSYRGLISLKTLDMSRNSLQTAPSEAFSYLTWLNSLNLDLNSWNCSCQLLELATFLSTFMQEPDKTLYNGRRMVCVSADNPAVTTVLELTEANCVPSNQNITVRIDTRGSITPHLYVRDMAITGVVCFTGGVVLALLIVLIYYKWSNKKKQREQQNQEVKDEESSSIPNQNHHDGAERRKDIRISIGPQDNCLGTRTEDNRGQFRCPECRREEPNPVRWEKMNGRIEMIDDQPRVREEEWRRSGTQQRHMGREAMNRHFVGNSIDVEGQNRQDVLHCGSCHRTFKPNHVDQIARQARPHPRNTSAIHGLLQQRPNNDLGRTNFYRDFDIKNLGLKRETRNVTFNLESPRRGQGKDGENKEATTPKENDRQQDSKPQSGRPIKVKLNLNPLRKSKVHPKEKGSPRKGKDKHGNKGKKKKSKKSKDHEKEETKSEQPGAGQETVAQVAAPVAMGHMQGLPGAQFRGRGMLMGNRTTNLLGASGPQLPTSSLPFQGGNFPLNSIGPGNAMLQTGAAYTMGPNMNLSGPIMAPGGAPDIMRRASMGLAAGQNSLIANTVQTGLNPTPLQASSATLQATPSTLQSNAIIPPAIPPTLQANPAILQATVTVPQASPTTLSANPSLFQASVPALQANPSIVQTSTTNVQASTKQNSPTTLPTSASSQNLQALATNFSETTKVVQSDSKNQPTPKSSPRIKDYPTQEPLPPSNDKPSAKSSETLASPRQDSQTPLAIASSPVVAPQSAPAKTLVENLSISTGLTGFEPFHGEGSMVTQDGGPTAVMTVGGTQAADVSISGVPSVPTGSEDTSTTLIQQEYLSEEGGNSSRRKLRLVIPEKTSSRPPTALERKIR